MKKFFLLPFTIAVIFFVLVFIWFFQETKAPSKDSNFKFFVIEKGESASQIGIRLEHEGLIKNALVFKIYSQFAGFSGRIQAGEYKLSPSHSLFETLFELTRGPVEVWITIPEGLRREEIASKFAEALDKDITFKNQFLAVSADKEGFLFPDTYLFSKEADALTIINKMLDNFKNKTSGLGSNQDLTFNQRIILASIIEREVKKDEERPIVAGILINRLRIGMPLQVDATIQYAVATNRCQPSTLTCSWWQPLELNDFSINSPYNTYLTAGLPPTPISNPGISSIKAAFNPAQTEYYYYIHDASGQIYYARTIDEQNENIAKYLH